MTSTKTTPLFPLGQVVATSGAVEALRSAEMDARELLRRHVKGDWGDVSPDDARENELSVREGFRILSSYRLSTGITIWSSPSVTAPRPRSCFRKSISRLSHGAGSDRYRSLPAIKGTRLMKPLARSRLSASRCSRICSSVRSCGQP